AIEDWPSVFVLPQRASDFTLVDVLPDAGQIYRVTYRVQVLAWVRHTGGYQHTDDLRKRYALAIREALLARVSLGDPAQVPAEFVIAPGTLAESYSDVIVDESRTIAGVSTEVDVVVAEALATVPTLGTVQQATATVDASLPQHPAL
ncbi:MAG: hypothetical protein RR101_15320, partial [Burkholderiaceae bacterium]